VQRFDDIEALQTTRDSKTPTRRVDSRSGLTTLQLASVLKASRRSLRRRHDPISALELNRRLDHAFRLSFHRKRNRLKPKPS
jgi:hypothetical protein